MNPTILIASILGLFIGLTVTFFGERIFKISLSSTGFGAGFMLASGIAYSLFETVIIAGMAGLVVGFISLFLVRSAYRTGLFLIGFAMAAIIVTYISLAMDAVSINIQNLEDIDSGMLQQVLPLLVTGFVASMVSGALLVIFDTPLLRILTGIFGAIIFSISGFVLTTGMDTLPQSTAQLVSVQLFVWGVAWIPLGIAGIVFQFIGVTWLLNFLQMDKASRQERARQKAYQASKRQQMMTQRPPDYGQPPAGGYPPHQQPPSQGYPQQPPHNPTKQPSHNRPVTGGNPQRRQSPPDQPPRKPRP